MRTRALIGALTSAATVAAVVLTSAAPATAADSPTPVPQTKPTWVSGAKKLGDAKDAAAVSARVYLVPRGGVAAMQAEALALSTPGSADYHRFLTPAQVDARFAPTSATVAKVTAYLQGQGFTVTTAARSRYLAISGDVATAEKAFSANIARFTHAGAAVQAPTGALKLPADIAADVSTVIGLDTTPLRNTPARPTTEVPPPAGFRNATPCSTYYGQKKATTLPQFEGKTLPYSVCGYTGAQLRTAYVGRSNLTGKGVTIGITDAYASPTIAADASKYAARHGNTRYARGQLKQVTPSDYTLTGEDECDASGWFGEETLDVEAVHAIAPKANITYYAGSNCEEGLDDALAQAVDDNKVDVITNSWGLSGEDLQSELGYLPTFLEAALQGITIMFSSGDSGDELAATGVKSADTPATDPFVTAVGGTATAIGRTGKLLGSTGWGTEKYSLSADAASWMLVTDKAGSPFLYGSGGGTSAFVPKPLYQRKLSGDFRQVPDMAMDADPTTGMLVGETQTFSTGVAYDEYRIGGTSLASPLFAGMTALSLQYAGHRAGLLNPVIYASGAKAFKDVTGNPLDAGNVRSDFINGENASDGIVSSVRTFDQDSSLAVTPGYDEVTGVGVPTTGWLHALRRR